MVTIFSELDRQIRSGYSLVTVYFFKDNITNKINLRLVYVKRRVRGRERERERERVVTLDDDERVPAIFKPLRRNLRFRFAGMHRQHLSGLRSGVLSVHRCTRRSSDQELRALLQIAWGGSALPVSPSFRFLCLFHVASLCLDSSLSDALTRRYFRDGAKFFSVALPYYCTFATRLETRLDALRHSPE